MLSGKKWYVLRFVGLFLAGLAGISAFAQPIDDNFDPNVGLKFNQKTITNQFPCGECAVFDNNGNDLRAFVKSNKNELSRKAALVSSYSGNNWGYLEIKDARTPSIDRQGNLNYYQLFDVTLGLYQTASGAKSTWWARECNSAKGPLVNIPVDAQGKLGVDLVKYTEMLHDLEFKKLTLVEYYNDNYNIVDYDNLFNSYVLMKSGTLKSDEDYKGAIDFISNFLSKFSSVNDPLLENKSFFTCFTVNNKGYIAYFNIVNSKLAGVIQSADIQYEKDKDVVVNNVFRQLTGSTVFVFGDNVLGLDKALIRYGHAHNINLVRKKPAEVTTFNMYN